MSGAVVFVLVAGSGVVIGSPAQAAEPSSAATVTTGGVSVGQFKLPAGSLIRSGKALRIETPFHSDHVDYLLAIKQRQQQQQQQQNHTSTLKIVTKLITPQGTVASVHTQELPKFYHEILKYATLIQFL